MLIYTGDEYSSVLNASCKTPEILYPVRHYIGENHNSQRFSNCDEGIINVIVERENLAKFYVGTIIYIYIYISSILKGYHGE